MNNDKFALGKKWFWIGMVMALNTIMGIVYGIALVIEKKHRREGLIILVFTFAWAVFGYFILAPWLKETGILPRLQVIR